MDDFEEYRNLLLYPTDQDPAPLSFNYYNEPNKEKYLVKDNIISDDDDKKIKTYLYPSVDFTPEDEKKAQVILLIGQTGNGKTTLINFLINALLGVKYDDEYRYKIIVEEKRSDESKSNTKGVNSYNIKIDGYPYPIKIIDSQGVGDTRGPELDEELIPKLKEIFSSINHINCICFVVKETDIRLGSSQQYIYKTCLDVFAKDVKKNFVIMLTNSHFEDDPENIPVLKTLKLEESFFNTVIPNLDQPYYFQFENGSLFSNVKNKRNKMYFEESMDKMNQFLQKKLKNLKPVPTKNCAKVCVERIQQKLICQNLMRERDSIVTKKKLIEMTKNQILDYKKEIINNPNIKIKDYEIINKKKNLPEGKHNTVCNNCKVNCHPNCIDTRILGLDLFKYWCVCFDFKGCCKICRENCFMHSHEYANFEYYVEIIPLELTLEEIFQKKCQSNSNAKSNIDKLNEIIKRTNIEIKEKKKIADILFQELQYCLLKLNDLALNPYNFQLIIKMYDNLIIQEEELGNSNKIENLKQQRERYIFLNKYQKEKEEIMNCSIF
jgi:signal recognition particle GTPase